MNCKDAERLIYLADTTDPAQLEALHAHTAACEPCAALMRSVQRTQGVIEALARQQDCPVDAERLTDKILTGIRPAAAPARAGIRQALYFMRLTLGLLSLALIAGFVYERYSHQNTNNQVTYGEARLTHPGGSAVLREKKTHSASLHALLEGRTINSKY